MTFEAAIGYLLSFVLGAVVALFWAYSGHGSRLSKLEQQVGRADLSVMTTEISNLKTMIASMGIIDMAADVRMMKNSMIFTTDFQQKLGVVLAEYKDMHDQIEKNGGRLLVLETKANIKSEK